MTAVSDDLPTHRTLNSSLICPPPPWPLNPAACDRARAVKPPEIVKDKVEPLNRCGERRPIKILDYKYIKLEKGPDEGKLPAVTSKEDLEESEGLDKPKSASNADAVPKLDRMLDEDGQLNPDVLIVHDPDNLTRLARDRPALRAGEPLEPEDTPDPCNIKSIRQDAS
ncbi:hypothetical protein FRB96_000433 [Tulasnella sp. 330]|nr:hypothetical protein FRB96_000433 [Tulasnella sp. 330]KAG8887406.1 hypothetical protein FRB98_009670 [Tulasnella sp. 332]